MGSRANGTVAFIMVSLTLVGLGRCHYASVACSVGVMVLLCPTRARWTPFLHIRSFRRHVT